MKQLNLNWPAYFKAFCKAHGGSPVEYKGRQLFSDGWMYAIKDYAGPEWPAPADPRECRRLVIRYWLTRSKILRRMSRELRNSYDNLKVLQSTKSVPLQATVSYYNEQGQLQKEIKDIEFGMLELEMNLINEELNDSLKELQKHLRHDPHRIDKHLTNGHGTVTIKAERD